MKKTVIALLLVCALLTASLSALGEAAPAYEPIDYGDFTMAINPETPYSGGMQGKVENSVWFTLYPAFIDLKDSNTNFNVVWSQKVSPIGSYQESNRDAYVSTLEKTIRTQYESLGVKVTSFSVPFIQLQKLDSKDALAYMMITELEIKGQAQAIYQLQAIVSDEAFGTYTFTGSATTMELLETYVAPLFDAIAWKN